MQIRFAAYAGDCRISGTLDHATNRLADVLDAGAPVILRRAVLERLDDGRRMTAERLELAPDDLYAVEAGRNLGRRTGLPLPRMIRRAVHLQLGPYGVTGEVHGRIRASLSGRHRVLALSGAAIAYVRDGQLEMHEVEGLLVNLALADWLVAPGRTAAYFPDVRTSPVPA